MIIHSVEIENFRGITHLTLGELPETGVFVISGDNEQGKSTVLEAISCALTEPHHTKKKEIKAIQPVGQSVAPTVKLRATVGEYTFTIEKRWLKAAASRLHLTAPRPAQYVDREADNELQQILENNVDRNLLDKLFISQDELDPELAAVGIPSLEKALNSQTGGDEDYFASSDDDLMRAVEEEYGKYYTAKGQVKKSSELDRAESEHAAALAAKDAAVAEVKDLRTFVQEVERAHETIELNVKNEPSLVAARDNALHAVEKATAIIEELEKARGGVEQAQEKVKYVRSEQDRLDALKAEEKARTEAVQRAHDALVEAQEAADKEAVKITELAKRVAEAREAEDRAYQELDVEKKTLKSVVEFAEFQNLRQRIAQIDETEKAITAARSALPEHPLSKKDLAHLEKLHATVEVARAVLQAAQATLEFTGEGRITVDGETYEAADKPNVHLNAGSTIRIGDVTAIFSPGKNSSTTVRDELDDARTQWKRALEKAHLLSLDEAYERRSATETAEETLSQAQKAYSDAVGDIDVPQTRQRCAELEQHWNVRPEPKETADAVEKRVRELEEVHRAATLTLRTAENEREPWLEKKAASALTQANARHELAVQECERVSAQLQAMEKESDEESLAQRVAVAERNLEASRTALQEIEVAYKEMQPQEAEDRNEAAEAKLKAARKRIQDARDTVNQYQGRIEQAQGAEERQAQAEDRYAAAEAKLNSIRRQANAAKVLRTTLRAHQDAARQRYAQPFADALQEMAQPIFGADVRFNLDDTLRIVERTQGDRTVPVGDLSGGAKEQLMLLSRFAVAKLADGSSDSPVPVFIDDALGNTDTGRLNDMAMMVNRLGKKRQVFVLTCVPERFDAVANKHDYPMSLLRSR